MNYEFLMRCLLDFRDLIKFKRSSTSSIPLFGSKETTTNYTSSVLRWRSPTLDPHISLSFHLYGCGWTHQ